jgi:hypothetical protein
MDKLSDDGFLKYKNAVKVEALSVALEALNCSVSLDDAKDTLRMIRDSYELSLVPGVRDEGTDHQL